MEFSNDRRRVEHVQIIFYFRFQMADRNAHLIDGGAEQGLTPLQAFYCVSHLHDGLIWWHWNYIAKKCYSFAIHFQWSLTAHYTARKWICCFPLRNSDPHRIREVTAFEFVMNAIHHIYSINRQKRRRQRSDLIAKQSQIECVALRVWAQQWRQWMNAITRREKNPYRLDPNCNYVCVNCDRCRNCMETRIRHADWFWFCPGSTVEQKKWVFDGTAFMLRLSMDVNSWEWIHVWSRCVCAFFFHLPCKALNGDTIDKQMTYGCYFVCDGAVCELRQYR